MSGGRGVDDLLGAWSLGALDELETAEVDALLDRDRAAAASAAAFLGVVATLAEPLATSAPAELRESVLRAAVASRPVGGSAEGLDPVSAYAAAVDGLTRALAGVGPDDWSAGVAAYGWPLHRLVRHVVAVERYFVDLLGSPSLALEPDVLDHLGLGADDRSEPSDLPARWAALAASAVDAGRRSSAALERAAVFHGLPMALGTLFVVRAFELWTHADDVRRALRDPLEAPAPEVLRTMADEAVRGLPGLLLLAGEEPPAASIRVVLTGRGGGTWDVDLDLATASVGPPQATVVADVVDYCRFAARRIDIDALDHEVEGDGALARRVLLAAQALAV